METRTKIFLERTFNCSARELFAWLVKPELLVTWFGPKHLTTLAAKVDLRIGGEYIITLKHDSGSTFFIKGKYLEILPPYKLLFTFYYDGISSPPPDSTVDIRISPLEESQTQLTLIQYFDYRPHDLSQRTGAWEYMCDLLSLRFVSNQST